MTCYLWGYCILEAPLHISPITLYNPSFHFSFPQVLPFMDNIPYMTYDPGILEGLQFVGFSGTCRCSWCVDVGRLSRVSVTQGSGREKSAGIFQRYLNRS